VAIQSDGKIVVAGTTTTSDGSARDGLLIERYNANGTLDTHFGTHGIVNLLSTSFGDGYALAIQRDRKIIATGSDNAPGSGNGSYPRVALVRLSSSGRPDASFATHGIDVVDLGPFSYARAVAVQSDGKIVIAGSQSPGLRATNALIARFKPSGALDRSLAGTGYYAHQYAPGAAFSSFEAVATAPGGKIVAGGAATSAGNRAEAVVARLTGGGTPDRSFGSGGATSVGSAVSFLDASNTNVPGVRAIAVAPGGEIIAAGASATGVQTNLALWAFTAAGRSAAGFGSHGVTVVRMPSAGNTEALAIALAPDGSAALAGDAIQLGTKRYHGLLARVAVR
jgi:uncharacterized delta-60 repeat protein